MRDRRTFLRGLVSVPLIGGGVTLIGHPSAPVPLVQAAALPALATPLDRARYAWTAFSAAMDDATAGTGGWRIIGAGNLRPCGYVDGGAFLRVAEVHYEVDHDPRLSRPLVVERAREIVLDASGELRQRHGIRL